MKRLCTLLLAGFQEARKSTVIYGGGMVCMVKKSRESFWCFRGHGVEFFSFRCHLVFIILHQFFRSSRCPISVDSQKKLASRKWAQSNRVPSQMNENTILPHNLFSHTLDHVVDGNTLVFIKIFFFLYFRLLFNGNRACASNSMSTKYPSFSLDIYTPRVYAEVPWVQKQILKILKIKNKWCTGSINHQEGTGSLVNSHNCSMQLFFFFTFQYFQKNLSIVLDVPIHNLPRQKTVQLQFKSDYFLCMNKFKGTFEQHVMFYSKTSNRIDFLQ